MRQYAARRASKRSRQVARVSGESDSVERFEASGMPPTHVPNRLGLAPTGICRPRAHLFPHGLETQRSSTRSPCSQGDDSFDLSWDCVDASEAVTPAAVARGTATAKPSRFLSASLFTTGRLQSFSTDVMTLERQKRRPRISRPLFFEQSRGPEDVRAVQDELQQLKQYVCRPKVALLRSAKQVLSVVNPPAPLRSSCTTKTLATTPRRHCVDETGRLNSFARSAHGSPGQPSQEALRANSAIPALSHTCPCSESKWRCREYPQAYVQSEQRLEVRAFALSFRGRVPQVCKSRVPISSPWPPRSTSCCKRYRSCAFTQRRSQRTRATPSPLRLATRQRSFRSAHALHARRRVLSQNLTPSEQTARVSPPSTRFRRAARSAETTLAC